MLKSYTERFASLELSTILKAIDDYRQKKDTPVLRCYRLGLECRALLKEETEPFIQYGLYMLKMCIRDTSSADREIRRLFCTAGIFCG